MCCVKHNGLQPFACVSVSNTICICLLYLVIFIIYMQIDQVFRGMIFNLSINFMLMEVHFSVLHEAK
jgi:hypothetical protein